MGSSSMALLLLGLLLSPSLALLPRRAVRRQALARAVASENKVSAPADKPYSFVQDDLRAYAMKLHTRDQAPKEGQQKAEKPFTQWQVQLSQYVQFLVDSLAVYDTFEQIVAAEPQLASLRNSGLERGTALRQDLAFLLEYDPSLTVPLCGPQGAAYSELVRDLAKESLPKFMCHYYNHYFAHTAGGRMIGKKMADQLLGGKTLAFYTWEGDVKALSEAVRVKIDEMAALWTDEEKQACMGETMACFRFGGALMSYMRAP